MSTTRMVVSVLQLMVAQLLSLVWLLSLSSTSAIPASIITIDMYWHRGSPFNPGDSIARLQYAYDLMGNRIEAVRTPRLMAVQTDERQEQANKYDAFNRLTQWLAKDVDGQSQHLFLHRQDVWALDLLGNWKARSSTFGAAPPKL